MKDLKACTLSIPQGARTGPESEPIYGYKEVSALCLAGLAVHRTNRGARFKWTVTHAASGLQMQVLGAGTRARAIENMRAAVALDFDWTRPEKETLAAMGRTPGLVPALRKIGESN